MFTNQNLINQIKVQLYLVFGKGRNWKGKEGLEKSINEQQDRFGAKPWRERKATKQPGCIIRAIHNGKLLSSAWPLLESSHSFFPIFLIPNARLYRLVNKVKFYFKLYCWKRKTENNTVLINGDKKSIISTVHRAKLKIFIFWEKYYYFNKNY